MTTPVKKRIRKSKAERRREIAEAALKLMGKHGFYGTTVARIAKAVGISNSALYAHFHNREAVLWAATDLIGERAHDWIYAASGANGLQHIDKISENHLPWSTARIDTFARPVFSLVAVAKQAGMASYTRYAAQKSFDLLLPIVEEGQRDGSIRTDVAASDIAWGVLMFAWAEDMALLAGIDEVTSQGASRRLFTRLLASFAPPAAQSECPEPQGDSADQESVGSPNY